MLIYKMLSVRVIKISMDMSSCWRTLETNNLQFILYNAMELSNGG